MDHKQTRARKVATIGVRRMIYKLHIIKKSTVSCYSTHTLNSHQFDTQSVQVQHTENAEVSTVCSIIIYRTHSQKSYKFNTRSEIIQVQHAVRNHTSSTHSQKSYKFNTQKSYKFNTQSENPVTSLKHSQKTNQFTDAQSAVESIQIQRTAGKPPSSLG